MSSARTRIDRRRFLGTAAAGAALAAFGSPSPAEAHGRRPHHRPPRWRPLFLGTYTTVAGGGTGLGLGAYDADSGRITATGTLPGVPNPSYLALAPRGRTLYTVNETLTPGENGSVTAIALSADGRHRVLGARTTGGAGPCHLSVHPSGRWLLSANYLSGSVAVHPVHHGGALGELTDLVTHFDPPPGPGQSGPHAHQIVTAPDGRHILAVDLGNDTVYTYRLDTSAGRLRQISTARLRPGAGPRHLTFHPSGRFAYLANEVDNTAVVCAYDRHSGRLTPGAPQPTGTGPGTSYPAQFLVTRNGAFAYLANRGHNSISRYAIEARGARLRLLDTVPVRGDFPRHIAFSPSQRLLFAANQRSNSVTAFTANPHNGTLTPFPKPFTTPIPVFVLPL